MFREQQIRVPIAKNRGRAGIDRRGAGIEIPQKLASAPDRERGIDFAPVPFFVLRTPGRSPARVSFPPPRANV